MRKQSLAALVVLLLWQLPAAAAPAAGIATSGENLGRVIGILSTLAMAVGGIGLGIIGARVAEVAWQFVRGHIEAGNLQRAKARRLAIRKSLNLK